MLNLTNFWNLKTRMHLVLYDHYWPVFPFGLIVLLYYKEICVDFWVESFQIITQKKICSLLWLCPLRLYFVGQAVECGFEGRNICKSNTNKQPNKKCRIRCIIINMWKAACATLFLTVAHWNFHYLVVGTGNCYFRF